MKTSRAPFSALLHSLKCVHMMPTAKNQRRLIKARNY